MKRLFLLIVTNFAVLAVLSITMQVLGIDRALAQLSYEHRTVLILHEFEDLEYKEIAKRMQCSIGTVMSRLSRARQALRKYLDGEETPSLRRVK